MYPTSKLVIPFFGFKGFQSGEMEKCDFSQQRFAPMFTEINPHQRDTFRQSLHIFKGLWHFRQGICDAVSSIGTSLDYSSPHLFIKARLSLIFKK